MSKGADMSFGATLRRERTRRGIGLREMASRVGISASYLSRVELGAEPPPTEGRLLAMAKALGSDADEMIGNARRVPRDVVRIMLTRPVEMFTLIRALEGASADQICDLAVEARDLVRSGHTPRPIPGLTALLSAQIETLAGTIAQIERAAAGSIYSQEMIHAMARDALKSLEVKP